MKGKETKEREREGRQESKGEICEKGGQECKLRRENYFLYVHLLASQEEHPP